MRKEEIVQALGAMERRLDQRNAELTYVPVTNYASKVVRRQQLGRDIAVWSDAIDAALAETGGVYFPASDSAYYIDRPIVLDSGMSIKADACAIIRLVGGVRVCMVRNRNLAVVRGGAPGAVAPSGDRDHDISVTGGTWDHASSTRGHEDVREAAVNPTLHTAWGMFLFLNVSGVSLTKLRIMRCPAYAFLAANGEDLLFRDIYYEECFSDGVHIQGPAKNVVIKDMAGCTGDDFFAVDSWRDEVSEGPVDHVWIKGLRMEGSHRGMRLLSSNGVLADYSVTNVVVEDVTGTRDCKMYPCLAYDTKDVCDVGFMDWIYFENIDFLDSYAKYGYRWNGRFLLHTNVGHIHFKDIRGGRPSVSVGPVPYAYASSTPPGYTLDFNADLDCQVEEMILEGVPEADRAKIVECVRGERGVGKVKTLIFK